MNTLRQRDCADFPNYPSLDREERNPFEQASFLIKSPNMQGEYLGSCLDSIRWGSPTDVMYETDEKRLTRFVKNWMEQNKDDFEKLWHIEKIEDVYEKFELPYIKHETCPRDETHKEILKGLDGVLRCNHTSKRFLKPSFICTEQAKDTPAGIIRRIVEDSPPENPLRNHMYYAGNLREEFAHLQREYQRELERYEDEEATFEVTDFCHAILSDEEKVLSLEKVLERLNLNKFCKNSFVKICVFPFDGWDLAFHVQKWYEQEPKGKAPFLE